MAYANAKDGVQLYYDVVGEGPALTFAHGAGGNTASWFQQVPHFYDRYRTLSFDHRGFGRSRCEESQFDVEHFADDLTAILDDAGIEKTALVCQSMGGWTGINFCIAHPDRVSCLVMSHTTGSIRNKKIGAAMAQAAAEREAPHAPFGSWAIAHDLPLKDPVKANLYREIGAHNVVINLEKVLSGRSGLANAEPADLTGFNIPTLFITGSLDVLIPPAAVREAASLVPGARVEEFEGYGHSSYFECPDKFNAVAGAFLDAHNQ